MTAERPTTTGSRILQQGVLDGFCLPYAVANAFKALTCPGETALAFRETHAKAWRKIVSLAPSLENLASGVGSYFGMETAETNQRIKGAFIQACLDSITEDAPLRFTVTPTEVEEVADTDFSRSVLIFCLDPCARCRMPLRLDHWVCAVDCDGTNVYLACSFTAHVAGTGEGEESSPQCRRPFNNRIACGDLTRTQLDPKLVYRVEKCGDGVEAV